MSNRASAANSPSRPVSTTEVEQRLKLNVAILVALSAVLLSIAQQSFLVPLTAAAAALVAYYVTDVRGWFRFNRIVANLVALLAAMIVLMDFRLLSSNRDHLTAITNLLLCLQFVLLFQEKTPRTYGYLAVLSVLQVIVSAALPMRVEFALVLVPFMVTAVFFLANLHSCALVWPKRKASPLSPEARLITLAALLSATAVILHSDLRFLARFLQFDFSFELSTRMGIVLVLVLGVFLLQFLRIRQMPEERGRRRRLEIGLLAVGAIQAISAVVIGWNFVLGAALFAALPIAVLILKIRGFFEPSKTLACSGDTPAPGPTFASLLGAPPIATVPHESDKLARELVSLRTRGQIAAFCAATLVFAAVLFASVPRPRGAQPVAMEEQAVVSAPEGRITLNELTDVIQGDEIVMSVEFRDERTGELYPIYSDVYLRGTVLQHYDPDQYTWMSSRDRNSAPLQTPAGGEIVRQRLLVQPLRIVDQRALGTTLYLAYPCFNSESGQTALELTDGSKRIRMPIGPGDVPQTRRFELLTTAFHNGLQMSVYPHEYGSMIRARGDESILLRDLQFASYFDRDTFPKIAELADRIVAEVREEDSAAGRWEVCRSLMSYFVFSEDYHYTLEFSKVERTPGVDPIEDFVANHHQGHCEYFASALVLALRSQGIPSRLVVGYRGGNYNSLGGFYEFRQRHAHSWVEAYLEPEDVTESMLPPGQTAPYGAWMRLDPTPPSDEGEDFLERTGLLAKADELYGFARLMWLDYVVNMNAQRQQEAVINPIVSGTRSAEESLLGRDHWTQKDLRSRIESAPLWLYGLAALTAVLLVGLVVRMLKLRRRARHEEDMARRRRPPRPAPFYDRLVALLRRHGLARTSAQTQREFAGLVGGQLSESGLILDSALVRDCAAVPRHVVEAYYRVRFGGQELATEELFELDQSLDQLEEALKLHRGLPRRKLQRAAIPTAPMPPSPRESRRG